ncbi:hypothetical protein [Paludibacterium yongneupense]|uniref:hypothetical protein n=1 Tax=Paludibacterium yongneupense TaxID=400061 RepID=UPI00055D54B9|nr:hypothetical protein [Paludibacterium yongneupense]
MRLLSLVLLLALCACAGNRPPPSAADSPTRSVAQPLPKSTQLLKEANRLADQVKEGRLNRLEAADELNIFRLRLVGANAVDDASFATYRALAIARDAGSMTSEAAQARMQARLRDLQRRWPAMSRKPADPAFTNFLLNVYGMPVLENRK